MQNPHIQGPDGAAYSPLRQKLVFIPVAAGWRLTGAEARLAVF